MKYRERTAWQRTPYNQMLQLDLSSMKILLVCKRRVFENKSQSMPQLNGENIRVISELKPQLCPNVIENDERVNICGAVRRYLILQLPMKIFR